MWSSPSILPKGRPRNEIKTLDDEMDLLVAHGVLHLLGYDDATPTKKVKRCRHREILGEKCDSGDRAGNSE